MTSEGNQNIRLTGYTQFSGCGAKLGPGMLDKALCSLSQPHYPKLMVDYHGSDDSGVWKVDDNTALLQTVDFFPPIVDDPFCFGRIAAANALSDVYAMGGRPVTALSIVAFPVDAIDIQILRRIMNGALDALKEAGAALVGGHSINDAELKFGLAVTGLVHPEKVLRNNTLAPGDHLILTKPIGTGCINRALKASEASEESVDAATRSMLTLNKKAAEILSAFPVNACTDVTGFGLLGHACEMIADSGYGLQIHSKRIPLLPGVEQYIAAGLVPGGTARNREFRERWIRDSDSHDENWLNLLFDPQTSGGLLASVPADTAEAVIQAMRRADIEASDIGEVVEGRDIVLID